MNNLELSNEVEEIPAVVKMWDWSARYFSPEIEEKTWWNIKIAHELMAWVWWHSDAYWEKLDFLPENYDSKILEVVAYYREAVAEV